MNKLELNIPERQNRDKLNKINTMKLQGIVFGFVKSNKNIETLYMAICLSNCTPGDCRGIPTVQVLRSLFLPDRSLVFVTSQKACRARDICKTCIVFSNGSKYMYQQVHTAHKR